jgi:hypothetical protein
MGRIHVRACSIEQRARVVERWWRRLRSMHGRGERVDVSGRAELGGRAWGWAWGLNLVSGSGGLGVARERRALGGDLRGSGARVGELSSIGPRAVMGLLECGRAGAVGKSEWRGERRPSGFSVQRLERGWARARSRNFGRGKRQGRVERAGAVAGWGRWN